MAKLNGYQIIRGAGARIKDTGYLDGLVMYRGANPRLVAQNAITSGQIHVRNIKNQTLGAQAYVIPNYYSDLYKRIIVIPHTVNLGSISTDQTFKVQVWNANKSAVKLLSVSVVGGEGIELVGPTSGTFNALALKKWTVKVGMQGTPEIDCVVTFNFLGKNPVTLRITGSRSTDWSFMPDWSEDVTENLEWLTRVHQSVTAAEQRIARRLSPRRTFEFKVSFSEVERQLFESALYGYGSRVWSLPIFTDCARLLQPVQQGAVDLPINTGAMILLSAGAQF